MTLFRFLLPLVGAAVISAQPALAGARSIIFTPPDFGGTSSGFDITDGGNTSGVLRFTLPQDFKENSKARLRFIFHNYRPACVLNFGITDVSRNRAGFREIAGVPGAMGFVGAEPGPVSLGGNRTRVKSYEMTTGNFGAFAGQKLGDVIKVSFIRILGGPDTCSGLVLIGVELRYTTP